ncbi:MAG: glycosyltransferase family 4 protein [Planctomycetes bacterium]|nr:glycosyltransferase family 4 protein [Planctomycetota bacterium]
MFSFLKNYDVIHTTDAFFTLSKTARFFARRFSRPLVNSIHTDIPAYTQIFTAQVVRRLAGNGYFSRFLLDRVRVHDFAAAFMHQRLIAYLKRCDWVLISKKNELNRFKSELPGGQVSLLRRGIDKEAFHPRRREPSLLRSSFGIAPDRFLLLFVGRIDAAKGVMTLAHAARLLLQKGLPVHVLMAGQGTQKEAVQELLGGAVTFSGALPQARLPLLYASSDLFVFPSETEECPNVVLEAKASGLPVLLSTRGGSAQLVKQEGRDGLLIEGSKPASWAGAIEFLMKDPEHLHRMREAARRIMELEWPSWQEVLEEDLLPVWQKVSQGATRSGRTKPGDRNISKMLSEIQ